MASIATKDSTCSGHGEFPARQAAEGESLLKINGVNILVQGCAFPSHSDGNSSHDGIAISSRPWFRVNGKPVCTVDDAVSCGSLIASGDNSFRIE